jgi:Amidohydrolase
VLAAPFKNVYAEIGTTFASTVITFPTVCAHILGQLLKFMGEDRVVFGSDAVWYGSPQWQIEALWRFQIPEEMCQRYGYPRLTPQIKRKILGLNSARLYGLEGPAATVSPAVYKPVPKDYESRITPELKRILEYPGFTAAAPQSAPESQFAQYSDDNLAKIKQSYAEEGGYRSNTRYGWLRTRA